jgi:hypothetical protein
MSRSLVCERRVSRCERRVRSGRERRSRIKQSTVGVPFVESGPRVRRTRACTHKIRLNVCFAPKATELLRDSGVTLRAMSGSERFYSVTASARPRSGIGSDIPSVLAVLRLMNNSTLVTSWIGRFEGFSPLRMRPTYPPAIRYASASLPP